MQLTVIFDTKYCEKHKNYRDRKVYMFSESRYFRRIQMKWVKFKIHTTKKPKVSKR